MLHYGGRFGQRNRLCCPLFVTLQDLNMHLDALLEYVAKLKKDLRQEATAIEVDHKLMMV